MMPLTKVVKVGNDKYYVSTRNTHDNGIETMIFRIVNYKGNEYIDWSGVYQKDYIEEAIKHHEEVINNIEKYINVGSEN